MFSSNSINVFRVIFLLSYWYTKSCRSSSSVVISSPFLGIKQFVVSDLLGVFHATKEYVDIMMFIIFDVLLYFREDFFSLPNKGGGFEFSLPCLDLDCYIHFYMGEYIVFEMWSMDKFERRDCQHERINADGPLTTDSNLL